MFRQSNESAKDRGGAFTEFVLALPFLCVIAFGIFDIGNMINEYLQLTHVVRAGVRYAMGVPGLTEGQEFYGQTSDQACAVFTSAASPTSGPTASSEYDESHGEIQKRMAELIKLDTRISGKPVCFRSRFNHNAIVNANFSAPSDSVTVTVEAEFDGSLPFFHGMPIRVQGTGPYLLPPS